MNCDLFQTEQKQTVDSLAPSMRPYQEEAVDATFEAWEDSQRALIVMPTGTGKTIVFGHIAMRQAHKGRTMVIAHRQELVYQARDKIGSITGEQPEVEMAGEWADQRKYQTNVVVASKDTLVAGRLGSGRMKRFDPKDFSLLVIDEAHHAPASTYKKVIDHFTQNPDLKVLGVTATPDRHDEQALGKVFETVAYDYEISKAIVDGWLVPLTVQSVIVQGLDLSEVKTVAGDLNAKQLAELMEYEAALHSVAAPSLEIAAGRKMLVFAASLAHAGRLCEIYNRHDHDIARFVHGGTPKDERQKIFYDFAHGDAQILVNVGVATEGYDCPGIQVVAIARPTKSRALYAQMVGRGTRPLTGIVDGLADAEARRVSIGDSGKPDLHVIDFVGNAGRHQLISAVDILGGNYDDDVVRRAQAKAKSGAPEDVQKLLDEAEKEIQEEKAAEEKRRRKQVKARARYTTQTLDPFTIFGLQPRREKGWDKGKPVTEKMRNLLEHAGVNTKDLTFAKASQLIGEVIKRRRTDKCTFKQARILVKYGYDARATFAKAKVIIDKIAANNWRPLN